jgi:hypothetical protein
VPFVYNDALPIKIVGVVANGLQALLFACLEDLTRMHLAFHWYTNEHMTVVLVLALEGFVALHTECVAILPTVVGPTMRSTSVHQ